MTSWSTSDPSWLLLRALPEWELTFAAPTQEQNRLAYLHQLLEAIDWAMKWAEDAQLGLIAMSEEGTHWLQALPSHFGELINRLDQEMWGMSVPCTQVALEIREALREGQQTLILDPTDSLQRHFRLLNRLQVRGELMDRTNLQELLKDDLAIPLAPLRWPTLAVSLDQLTQADSQAVIQKVARKLKYQAPPKPISEAEIVVTPEGSSEE
ncbi:MAG: hypothetical protein AAF399_05060 [Bacteroidota bacterium]